MSIDRYYNFDINLEQKTTTETATGDVIETWSHYMTILGRVRQLSASEINAAGKTAVQSTHRLYCKIENQPLLKDTFLNLDNNTVTMEEEATVERGYRLTYKGDAYRILTVIDPFNMGRFLQVDLMRVDYNNV